MKQAAQIRNVALALDTSQKRLPWGRRLLLMISMLGIASLACLPAARATCNEGCGNTDSTFLGENALSSNPGFNNTALGYETLSDPDSTEENTAVGALALGGGESGSYNTAVGYLALLNPIDGNYNTAIGYEAIGTGAGCSSGNNYNTAAGSFALFNMVCGANNTANGSYALYSNTVG